MQDCHNKINSFCNISKNNWSIVLAVILTPILLYAVLYILPTHDDWVGSSTPDFRPFFIKEHFLFFGYHWRPFDTWIGYIAGRNPQVLFPTFNHILVVLGHLLCTLAIYQLLQVLNVKKEARNIATFYFFITPATMATVTAVDSQNQVYALFFGIAAFLLYIKAKRMKYIVWPLLVFIAALSKENGLMWALICPILAYGFDFIDKKTLKKDIVIGIAIMTVYALAIILLPKDIIIHPEYVTGMMKIVKNCIKFLFSTFITVDYIYLLHQPSRNLLLAAITLILALPFFYFVFVKQWKLLCNKRIVCTLICIVIAVGPHLGTIFSMMHTYAGLTFVTVIIALSIEQYKNNMKPVILSFCLWVVTAVAINVHLILSSIDSGLIGKAMAQEAIQKTGDAVDRVYIIIIEDDYPKLSSFCVIPNEAFGWGLAAKYETNYQWPKAIVDTTIERSDDAFRKAEQLGLDTLKNKRFDCVWIVDKKNISVIK
mgnify:CR=1 FL=1